MNFYRPLRPFKAISYDLDDTLYDNRPIIAKAEVDFITYLTSNYKKLEALDTRKWDLYKTLLAQESPDLIHDVSLWRKEITKRIMAVYGMPMVDAINIQKSLSKNFLNYAVIL